jgi:hypothetical protein
MLPFVLALGLVGSGLAFHALARSPNAKVRGRGPWLTAAAFSVASVLFLAPFYRHDPSHLFTSYVLPQLVFAATVFGEAALLARWIFKHWPNRFSFLAAYLLLLTIVGGLTTVILASVYPGS